MGLDFRIDATPTVWHRELTGDPLRDALLLWQKMDDINDVKWRIDDALYGVDRPYEIRFQPATALVNEVEAPRFSYGGFMAFRQALWTEIRHPTWPDHLAKMKGFKPHTALDIHALRTGHQPAMSAIADYTKWVAEEEAWWEVHSTSFESLEPQVPLLKLINHSDCDGSLDPDECMEIAPHLYNVAAAWAEHEEYRHYCEQATKLAAFMDCAALNGRRLIFC